MIAPCKLQLVDGSIMREDLAHKVPVRGIDC